ncbi:TonB-dependent receptor [Caulobacter sp. FWC2]|uniref:TonB-dependent receptor n=1 Tax=Caulobacter sp. FWC2 TaxID=69664 RepID=UPI000C157DF5|nr:TonB-dependent receptor [Caulobacter sp. FWC2]PIB91377.1 TonB-dependent receptor [Caulobacter sp. FWC2]
MTSAKFRKSLMASGAFAVSLLAAAGAHAQTAPAPAAEGASEVEQIVVTGYRSSLSKALGVKRTSIGAVDAILAEDIAAFPDQNLAEAIQRLPGVTIDRVGGEGHQITVRGLNADFTRVRINGVEAIATGGGNRSRGFDFNVFASELFNSITVRKTQSADISEGSLGATVDLQSGRPFDYKGFKAAASAEGSLNSITDRVLPRVAGLLSWSNPDQTFGVLASVAYSKRQPVAEGFNTTRWQGADTTDNFASCSKCATPDELAKVQNAFYPRIPRYTASKIDSERLGVTFSTQWRPNAKSELSLDVLYSDLNQFTESPNLEAISFSRSNAAGVGATIVRDYALNDRNTFTYGVFDKVDVRSENGTQRDHTTFTQVTLAGKYEFTDRLRGQVRVGVANSDYRMPEQISFQLDRNDVNGYVYDARANDRTPIITYGFDVANPANFTLTEMRSRESTALNIVRTVNGALEFDVDEHLKLRGGVDAQQYVVKYRDASRNQTLTGANQIVGVGAFSKVVSFGRDFPFPGGDRSYVVADIDKAVAYTKLLSYPLIVQTGDTRDVSEDDLSGFGQAVVDATIFGGMPLRSDFGFRVAHTRVTAGGFVNNNTNYVTMKNDYTDVLPSMNITLEPRDNFILRGGIAKVMARPTLGSLTPGGSVSATTRTVNFGNPDLEPFRATNFDLAAEWYFASESLLSVAVFYKKIDSFIASQTSRAVYNTLGLPESIITSAGAVGSDIFDVTRPYNGDGGWLKGVEFQYQQPFNFLPDYLRGFGFIGNFTYVDSNVNYGTKDKPNYNTLTGQSKTTANATLYFERGKFSARTSLARRSKFLTAFPGSNGNNMGGTHGSTYYDFSSSYKLRDNFVITLEGINLGDKFTDAYVDTADRVSDYRHTGREILLGVRWTY